MALRDRSGTASRCNICPSFRVSAVLISTAAVPNFFQCVDRGQIRTGRLHEYWNLIRRNNGSVQVPIRGCGLEEIHRFKSSLLHTLQLYWYILLAILPAVIHLSTMAHTLLWTHTVVLLTLYELCTTKIRITINLF